MCFEISVHVDATASTAAFLKSYSILPSFYWSRTFVLLIIIHFFSKDRIFPPIKMLWTENPPLSAVITSGGTIFFKWRLPYPQPATFLNLIFFLVFSPLQVFLRDSSFFPLAPITTMSPTPAGLWPRFWKAYRSVFLRWHFVVTRTWFFSHTA